MVVEIVNFNHTIIRSSSVTKIFFVFEDFRGQKVLQVDFIATCSLVN